MASEAYSGVFLHPSPETPWQASYVALLGPVKRYFATKDDARDWLRRNRHLDFGTIEYVIDGKIIMVCESEE